MFASAMKVGKSDFDFLAHEDFIHQVIPPCGVGQLTHQPGGRLLDGILAFFGGRHTPKKPQGDEKCKPPFRFRRFVSAVSFPPFRFRRFDSCPFGRGVSGKSPTGDGAGLAGARAGKDHDGTVQCRQRLALG